MRRSPDILIIGAGIVGAACAHACARAGLAVTVIDCGPVGGGSTGAAMGHIVVMDDSDAQFALTAYSRTLWHALVDSLPAAAEADPCGTLWIAADTDELDAVARKQAFYNAGGVRVEVLDPPALRDAEPNLRPGLAGALRVPDDLVVYPPVAAGLLLDHARELGARLLLGSPVRQVDRGPSILLENGTRLEAGLVVHAAGVQSTRLLPDVPVRPRKGHLVITDRYPGFLHHQTIELGYLKSAHGHDRASVAFNVQPRRTGQILIGSSRQYDAVDAAIDHPLLRRMLDRAFQYMPGLAGMGVVRAWTGHRAATPDSLPLIGPVRPDSRHWLATGHEGLGITTSLATAQLLVDQILGRPSAIPQEPYLPSRFALAESAHA